jgi:hypothetical protein
MTTLTSTVPGAIAALEAHLANVVTALPSLNITAVTGIPVEQVGQNFIMVGEVETGQLLTGYHQDWRGFPASAERKSEEYGIPCTIRAWSGESVSTSPATIVGDAFTMLDAVMAELQSDPQATITGGYPLTPSGSWQVTEVDIPTSGPLGGQGWGVYMTFVVSIINVRLTS